MPKGSSLLVLSRFHTQTQAGLITCMLGYNALGGLGIGLKLTA